MRHGFDNSDQNSKPEGTVTVEKMSKSQNSRSRPSDDDFVDYEIVE